MLAILATKIRDYEAYFWVAAAICLVTALGILIAPMVSSSRFLAYLSYLWRSKSLSTKAIQEAPQSVNAIQETGLSSPQPEIVLKSIHVGFDEAETKGWITIDISMHNSSGITLRICNVIGHIELRPMASLPQWLPSPTFLASTTNNIPLRSDFHVILVQKFPEEAQKAAMIAWGQGRVIQLNFSELRISVSGNDNANMFLPLWFGATIEKKGDKYFTAELGALQ